MVSIVIIAVTIAVAIGLLVVYKKSIFGTFGEAGQGVQDFFGESAKGIQDFFQNPLGLELPDLNNLFPSGEPLDPTIGSPDPLPETDPLPVTNPFADFTTSLTDQFNAFSKSITDALDFNPVPEARGDDTPIIPDIPVDDTTTIPNTPVDDATTIPNTPVDDATTIPESEIDRTNNIYPDILKRFPSFESFTPAAQERIIRNFLSKPSTTDYNIPESEIDRIKIYPDILKRFPYFESFTPAAQERILKNFLSRQSTTNEIPDTPTAQRKIEVIGSSIQGKQFTGDGSFTGDTVRKSEFDEPTLRSKRQESDRIKEARRLAQEARDKAVAGLNRKNKESSDRNDELIRQADEANRKHHGKFFGRTPEQIALELTGGNISNF